MELYGEVVKHKTFGIGKIIEFKDNYVSVLFDEGGLEKKFVYPSAFGTFLESDNVSFLKKIEEDKDNIAQLEAEKKRITGYQEKLAATLKGLDEDAKKPKKVKKATKARIPKPKVIKS